MAFATANTDRMIAPMEGLNVDCGSGEQSIEYDPGDDGRNRQIPRQGKRETIEIAAARNTASIPDHPSRPSAHLPPFGHDLLRSGASRVGAISRRTGLPRVQILAVEVLCAERQQCAA